MSNRSYPPEIQDGAMRLWAQLNRPSWSVLAAKVNEAFGVNLSSYTLRTWHRKGIPIKWEDFESRYKSRLYSREAERLADEAAQVRDQVWVAMRALFAKLTEDMRKWKDGELQMKYKSADAFVSAYSRIINAYYKMFGDNEKAIEALLRRMDSAELAELVKETEQFSGIPEA